MYLLYYLSIATSEAAEIKHTRNTKVSPTKQRTLHLSSNSSVSSSNASSRVSANNSIYSEDVREFNIANKDKYVLMAKKDGRLLVIGHKSRQLSFNENWLPKLRTLNYNYDLYVEKADKNELGAVKETVHKQRLNDHVVITKDN